MAQFVVRYKCKQDRVEENEGLIKNVFAQLAEQKPEGVRYASFKAADGQTFVHIACIEGDDNPLAQLDAFKAFQAEIKDRCEEGPVPLKVSEVGNYGLL